MKPHLRQMWCIPPQQNAEFVCCMEDILDLYCQPYDPYYPVVCMDETSKQLVGETRVPIPAAPGQPLRFDHEYERCGTANVFLFTEPLAGWRQVNVTEQRTRRDWAYQIRELVDVHYPQAKKVRLVEDNLNTHNSASLYETFEPAEAHRLAEKLKYHYTPKHGSWLNVAEIELSVLGRQCLSERIDNAAKLQQEATRWQNPRNQKGAAVNWHFTTADTRIKLKRLYPHVEG